MPKSFRNIFITAIFFFGVFTPCLLAQDSDTLKILTVDGMQSETVELAVDLYNHSSGVVALQIRIVYDENVLTPTDIFTTYRTLYFQGLGYVWAPMYDPSMHSVEPGEIRLLAYPPLFDPDPYFIPVGRGPIFVIRFVILDDAQSGISIVEFESLYDGDNTLSDPLGGPSIVPILVDGYVAVGDIQNVPPVFDSNNPQSTYNASVGNQLQFTVRATDEDNDQITLSARNIPQGASFPENESEGEVTSVFTWTPQIDGTYNITFVAEDGYNTVEKPVTIYVGVSGNQPPIIYPIAAQIVAEGAHIEFEVRAYDPEGDIITLEAENVPPNAQFEVVQGDSAVSSTFYFDPDFAQGPDTIVVNFVAQDDFNNVSNMSVQIIILDAPNDFLEVEPDQGALPGAQHKSLNINLRNAKPVYGLQFDLIYDPQVLDIFAAIPDSVRAYDLAFFSEIIEDGRFRVMIFSLGLDSIKTGSGNIVEFLLDVDPYANVGPSEVLFDSASSVQDSLGASKDIISFAGAFNIDLLGDANLDDIVSVGDCVAVIAHLLDWIELGIRSFDAADYNRDGDVRIADLQEIVNHILGRSGGAPPPLASAGSIELIKEELYPGFQGEAPLWLSLNTEAAAVQFTIKYDSSEIEFYGITAGDMVSDLELQFNDTGNEINVVICDFDLSEFGPGDGVLVNLDIEIIGDRTDPATAINVIDFEIVNVDAHTLNVEVIGELPSKFTLYQNYPNPFNATTLISFEMPFSSFVKISVYNVLGQAVNELYSGYLEAGPHQVMWNGTGLDGKIVTSGIYFYRLQADGVNRTKKMLLVK